MPVQASRELLAIHLRTYGEDAVAEAVATLSHDDLDRIYERADHYLYDEQYTKRSGAGPLLAFVLAMAAVEVLEGTARPLRWKRRKLKGIWPGY